MVYKWKGQSPGVPAQVAGQRLEQLRTANNGIVNPHAVVEDARPEDSPLHPAFTWDDTTAAAKYRVDEARRLIRCLIHVQADGDSVERPRQTYVSIGTAKGGAGYIESFRAMSDAEMRTKVLADAVKQISALRARFSHLQELAELWPILDRIEQEGAA